MHTRQRIGEAWWLPMQKGGRNRNSHRQADAMLFSIHYYVVANDKKRGASPRQAYRLRAVLVRGQGGNGVAEICGECRDRSRPNADAIVRSIRGHYSAVAEKSIENVCSVWFLLQKSDSYGGVQRQKISSHFYSDYLGGRSPIKASLYPTPAQSPASMDEDRGCGSPADLLPPAEYRED